MRICETACQFTLELRNRFQALEETEAIEERWTGIKEGMCGASDHVLGFKNRSQLRWITGDSLKKAEERKKIKEKINATRSERRKGMLRKDYRAKDK